MLTFSLYLVSEGLVNSVRQKTTFHTRIHPLSPVMKFKTAVLKDVHPDKNTEPVVHSTILKSLGPLPEHSWDDEKTFYNR